MKPTITAGWAPGVFDSIDAAKRHLINTALRIADSHSIAGCHSLAEDWTHFAEDLNLCTSLGPFTILAPDGSRWFVHVDAEEV